jgi:hypothetical protein
MQVPPFRSALKRRPRDSDNGFHDEALALADSAHASRGLWGEGDLMFPCNTIWIIEGEYL